VQTLVTWLILAVLVVLQTSFIVHMPFFRFVPELLLMFCVYVGSRFNWDSGFWWGITCGMVMSVFSIQDIRLYVIVFSLSGLIAGSFRGALFVDSNATKIILLFFISAAAAFVFAVFSKEATPSLLRIAFLQNYVIRIAFINGVFAIPLYHFLGKIYKRVESR